MDILGTVIPMGTTVDVHFQLGLDHAPDDVWGALTEQQRLADWLNTSIELDPREGGALRFEFGDGDVCEGTVLAADPPRLLEYEWRFPDSATVVRWELDPVGAATLLSLRHIGVDPDDAAGHGAGWHAHLDALEAELRDQAPDRERRRWDVWQPRYRVLRPFYDRLAHRALSGVR